MMVVIVVTAHVVESGFKGLQSDSASHSVVIAVRLDITLFRLAAVMVAVSVVFIVVVFVFVVAMGSVVPDYIVVGVVICLIVFVDDIILVSCSLLFLLWRSRRR